MNQNEATTPQAQGCCCAPGGCSCGPGTCVCIPICACAPCTCGNS